MPSRERNRFVMEEEERVVMRPPLLVVAAPELECTRDPKIARVEADDLPAGVENAAVPRPRPSKRNRDDVTRRRHTVLSRCHPIRLTTSGVVRSGRL
jgi:hypothetical protein